MMTIWNHELQTEFQALGATDEQMKSLDAPDFIPAGSCVATAHAGPIRQAIYRELMRATHDAQLIAGPWPKKKKRGRPTKPDTQTNAERQAAFRAKRRENGICPCCGQTIATG